MDHIITFKKKHMKISDAQIIDLLQSRKKLIDHAKEEQNQCHNDDMKIEELSSKITAMKNNLQAEKQALEYKNQDLSKELDCTTELEAKKIQLFKENQLLELERNKLRSCKRNLQDQELLDQGRRKFALYKELTRIRWDYERLKEDVVGYVTNRKKYIHYFCYPHQNTKDLSNLLWKEIDRSTVDIEDTDTLENVEHSK